ncbi:hypothetical protein ACIBF6_40680 [Streptosporangium amethystogenes]|uniref:effector-associated constant component EACC1 n=1 Tax=Streptosporangium TaxID=2000 RepID=UPI0034395E22
MPVTEGNQARSSIEITVSDPSQLRSLRGWLERVAGIQVEQVAGTPGPGEQGAADVLMLLGGGGALAVAIKTLPEFIRSRRSDIELTLKTESKEMTMSATNVDDIPTIIDKFRDAC